MLNPFRSEPEAFRFLLYVVAVFAVIIAVDPDLPRPVAALRRASGPARSCASTRAARRGVARLGTYAVVGTGHPPAGRR